MQSRVYPKSSTSDIRFGYRRLLGKLVLETRQWPTAGDLPFPFLEEQEEAMSTQAPG